MLEWSWLILLFILKIKNLLVYNFKLNLIKICKVLQLLMITIILCKSASTYSWEFLKCIKS